MAAADVRHLLLLCPVQLGMLPSANRVCRDPTVPDWKQQCRREVPRRLAVKAAPRL